MRKLEVLKGLPLSFFHAMKKDLAIFYFTKEIIEHEAGRGAVGFKYPTEEYLIQKFIQTPENQREKISKQALLERYNAYLEFYLGKINEIIDVRYRKKGFNINHIVYNGKYVYEGINLQKEDRVVESGVSMEENALCIYPNSFNVLEIIRPEKLVVTGFHHSDCVMRFAQSARYMGIETIIDDDLTERFHYNIKQPEFNIKKGSMTKEFTLF